MLIQHGVFFLGLTKLTTSETWILIIANANCTTHLRSKQCIRDWDPLIFEQWWNHFCVLVVELRFRAGCQVGAEVEYLKRLFLEMWQGFRDVGMRVDFEDCGLILRSEDRWWTTIEANSKKIWNTPWPMMSHDRACSDIIWFVEAVDGQGSEVYERHSCVEWYSKDSTNETWWIVVWQRD